MSKDTKHLIWATSLILIVLLICSTIIYINYNSWTLRFEMDDNTKEAIESIEYPIVDSNENYVNVCKIFKDGTADCNGPGAIDPSVIEIYGDCEYKFAFSESNEVKGE